MSFCRECRRELAREAGCGGCAVAAWVLTAALLFLWLLP